MNSDRFQRVMAVFEEVSSLDPAARRRVLQERLADDPAAVAEVESLLAHHDRNHSPVATAAGLDAVGRAGSWQDHDTPRSATPVLKGDYRILRTIGEGGMGVVFEAEQAFPRRRVALKAVRPGMASRSMLRRFRNEVQLLARLQHPGIAQIYEAGLADEHAADQAYFAMELIDGRPITHYASAARLDHRARLEILHRVCDAVQHAHQRGVIHRDLKPANILVTADGQPKMVDFGVARAAETSDSDASVATRVGQLIGTPAYMSPEQMRGEIVDTRSDIYALGVIAYELLAGRLPFDLSSRPISEAARIVLEEDPPALATLDRSLRGDAEVIVAKAMAKEPARRYSSAADMAEDIRRFLAGEPIAARRDSAAYLLRRQLQRYRTAAAMACVAVLALAVLAVHAMTSARAERGLALAAEKAGAEALVAKDAAMAAREDALAARAEAERAAAGALDELAQSTIERGRLEGLAGNLPFAEEILWRAHLSDPESAPAYWGLWELYDRHPIPWTVQSARPTRVAVAADGQAVGLALPSGEVIVHEAGRGREVLRMRVSNEAAASVAVSPNGALLAAGLAKGGISIVSIGIQHELTHLDPTAGPAQAARVAAWRDDGRTLATAHADRSVKLWDAITGEHLRTFTPFSAPVAAITFSRDGSQVAVGTDTPGIGLGVWHVESGELLHTLPDEQQVSVCSLSFSRDGSRLYAGTRDGIALAFERGSGNARVVPVPNTGPVYCITESPDGQLLLVSSGERSSLVDTASLTLRRSLARQRFVVFGGEWINDHEAIVGTNDGLLRRLDLRDDPSATRFTEYPSWCFSAAYSPDGRILAVGSANAFIDLFDTTTHQRIAVHTLERPRSRTRALKFLPDSRTLVSGGQDGVVRLIDTASGSLIAALNQTRAEIYALDIDPTGAIAASGHIDGITRVWDLRTREQLAEIPQQEKRVEGLTFSPDGRTLVITNLNSALQLWDVATRSLTERIPTASRPWGVAFSPDGSTLYTSTHGGTIEVFDFATRQRRATVQGHQRLAPGLAVSGDGRLIAFGGEEGIIKVFGTRTLRGVMALDPGAGVVVGLAFAPDSSRLAAATAGRLAIEYNLVAGDRFIRGNRPHQQQRLGPLLRAPPPRRPVTRGPVLQAAAGGQPILRDSHGPLLTRAPAGRMPTVSQCRMHACPNRPEPTRCDSAAPIRGRTPLAHGCSAMSRSPRSPTSRRSPAAGAYGDSGSAPCC